jgi:outer membrane protein OmpA-like peptidoglycan-associated protein
MPSLIDTIQGYLTSQILDDAASQLGENKSAVSKAMGGLIPAILAGMIGKAGDETALSRMHASLGEAASGGMLDRLSGLVAGGNLARNDPKDPAGAFIGSLFGDKVASLTDFIASFAGLKHGSASSLLGLAGPLVMGALGKKMRDGNLDASSLKRLLLDEKTAISKALPPGLSGALGLSGFEAPKIAANVDAAAPSAAAIAAAAKARAGAPAWLWAIPVALGVGLVGWMMTRGGKEEKIASAEPTMVETPAPAIDEPAVIAEAPASEDAGAIYSVEPIGDPLADGFVKTVSGFEIRGAAGGVESKLIGFIESGQEPCTDSPCWFTFDRLTFKTGSAELDMEQSAAQIENIHRILEAWPNIQLKIGGYTDNTGTDEANNALSQQRAEAVVAAVAALGADPARMDAEGYGPLHPVASNDTEEGRAQNRRIDVRVRQR